jgi:hypothetical protein
MLCLVTLIAVGEQLRLRRLLEAHLLEQFLPGTDHANNHRIWRHMSEDVTWPGLHHYIRGAGSGKK